MRITVTQEDIENGRRCDPDCCPIGRALSRAGVVHYGVVGEAVMVLDEQQHATDLPLPGEIREWILDFDGRRPVEPISFELPIPAHKPNTKFGHASRRQTAIAA